MGCTVDLMESAFEIALDGPLFLDEEFMMNIFDPIVSKLDNFARYLQYIFKEEQSFAVGSRKSEDKWLPFDE